MLKQRILTALAMVLLLGAAVAYLSSVALYVVFAVMVLLAGWEWSNLAGLSGNLSRGLFVLSQAGLMLAAAQWVGLGRVLDWAALRDLLVLACSWWALALLWVRGYPASAPLWSARPIRVLMGYLVLVPAWLAVCALESWYGSAGLLFLVALVAVADVGAYFSGRAWGKRKLAPKVSPGKSIAGLVGGMCASLLLALLWSLQRGEFGSWSMLLPVALVTVLASVLGDLLESMVKRERGVKDSGVLLPGHGGFMDRLDSLTAAGPVFLLALLVVQGLPGVQ